MQCPDCGKSLEGTPEFCYFCGYTLTNKSVSLPPLTSVVADTKPNSPKGVLISRYREAYQTANTNDDIGTAVKFFALVLAVALAIFSTANSGQRATSDSWVGLTLSVCVGAFFFVAGTLVSGVAQVQKATIDSAVYTSTFLTNSDRAEIMSLPSATNAASA
jgi:EamA domain-containing membrane protein RarD